MKEDSLIKWTRKKDLEKQVYRFIVITLVRGVLPNKIHLFPLERPSSILFHSRTTSFNTEYMQIVYVCIIMYCCDNKRVMLKKTIVLARTAWDEVTAKLIEGCWVQLLKSLAGKGLTSLLCNC